MTCGYSPSGTFVASGGLDNMCTVYNLKMPVVKIVKELDAHTGDVDNKSSFILFISYIFNIIMSHLINITFIFFLFFFTQVTSPVPAFLMTMKSSRPLATPPGI